MYYRFGNKVPVMQCYMIFGTLG
uniref:Uncharacterized protein n=1 Tax=Anguilla anguilla TaxID=7936 RepID=A0A0E9RAL9_ANGAN